MTQIQVKAQLRNEKILNTAIKHQILQLKFFSLTEFVYLCHVILPKLALLTDIFREAYFAILLRVKLGHFRKMVYWSVVRICLYLACIRIQRRDTYRWGLFSFFHKPTESKPSHRGRRSNKASLFFLCSLTSNY